MNLRIVDGQMEKRDFLKALHFACPKFKAGIAALESLLSSPEGSADASEAMKAILEKVEELQQKWPRASEFVTWPSFADWTNDWNSPSKRVSDLKTLFSSLLFEQAELEGIEIDPWIKSQHTTKGIIENLTEQEIKENSVKGLFSTINHFKKSMRQSAGERLFAKAAIIIPVYPETISDAIDWGVVQKLKARVYGQSVRQDADMYETAIKVFARGQLLEDGKAYSSWQEIADSVGHSLSTVRNIYGRAHEIVYGHPSKKRRYKSAETTTEPETVEEVLKNDGPGHREPLVSEITPVNEKSVNEKSDENDDTDLVSFRNVFDELREYTSDLCFLCEELKFAGHSDVTHDEYLKLGEYSPLPPYPDYEPFICNDCLTKIVSPKTTTD